MVWFLVLVLLVFTTWNQKKTLIFGFTCLAMGPCNYAVIGCINNSWKLEKWQKTSCEIHNGSLKSECCCGGTISFVLFPWCCSLSREKRKMGQTYEETESWKVYVDTLFKWSCLQQTFCGWNSKVFVERPKSSLIQAQTWSDYKYYNTFKFLIGISLTGFITFISSCYGGRTTDNLYAVIVVSMIYWIEEMKSWPIEDSRFEKSWCFRFCKLTVPPGAPVKAQMTSAECDKTPKSCKSVNTCWKSHQQNKDISYSQIYSTNNYDPSCWWHCSNMCSFVQLETNADQE